MWSRGAVNILHPRTSSQGTCSNTLSRFNISSRALCVSFIGWLGARVVGTSMQFGDQKLLSTETGSVWSGWD